MSQRHNAHVKKPSGGRPPPKRLFSFDSLRKEKEQSGNNVADQPTSNGPTLRLVEKPILEDAEDPSGGDQWVEKPLVASPQETEGPEHKEKGRRKYPVKPVPLDLDNKTAKETLAAADDAAAPPPLPSRRRWDTIRHHVLPVSGTEIPPRPSSPIDPPISAPARSSTPKGYRFGQKRNVRQVVDEVRAVDEARRFADDLLRACWTVRFGESVALGKPEREASQGTVGSGVYVPFMPSSASLPMSSSASVVSLQLSQKANNGLRRPPSIGSLALTNGEIASVTQIAKVITMTTSNNRPRHIPHEHLIWSALLAPFLRLDHTEADAERMNAIETFQMIIKTWKASSPQVSLLFEWRFLTALKSPQTELDRCLWCCKAAAAPSRGRPRIIATLSYLLFPKDQPFFAETPIILQTLLQALVSLVVDLS